MLGLAQSALLQALFAAACVSGVFTAAFSLLSVFGAHRFRRGRRSSPTAVRSEDAWPAVTILKPIKGLDREMHENLASFLSQDYPCYQVLFCLQAPQDPALPLLRRLKSEFPEADAEIVISGNRVGYNPKINNLSNAAPFIRHDILLISDSDVRVEVDFLRRAVRPLRDPSVGLVTCFYQSRRARGLGSVLEALSVNAQFLPQALVATAVGGMRFAMGAVMLLPRRVFEEAGGFAALSGHLADDYCLGSAVSALGYRVELASPVVFSVPDAWSIGEHLRHMVRWQRTIRLCQPAGYAGSVLLHGFAFLCLHALLVGPTPLTLALTAVVASARIGSVAWIHLVYMGNREIVGHLLLLPLSDLLQFAAWIAGFRSQTVYWRGEAYSVQAGGRLVPTEPSSVPSAVTVS